jgi:ketosteroid isomerase-like protein
MALRGVDGHRLGSPWARDFSVDEFRETVAFRWLSAGDRGDVDAFDDLLHPDVVIHAPAGLSTMSADAEKQVWREALAAMPDLRHEVQEVVVEGGSKWRESLSRAR